MAPTLYDVKPKPGDLIEISRGPYQHWAVYIGEGKVIHLAPPSEVAGAGASSMMSIICDRAVVKQDGFRDVVGTDKWQINNILDYMYQPRDADEVVKAARRLVGKEMTYCLFTSNCEHFATELRYGKAHCRQVRDVAIAAGGATAIGIGLVGLAWYFFGGGNKEKENKY